MRGGSTNNIYQIPAPHILTFGTATILAAASCIPAILSLMFTWTKILRDNWKKFHLGSGQGEKSTPEFTGIDEQMKKVGIVTVPLFSGLILALLVIGERNFSSAQVRYQTEPIASIGR